MPGSACAAGTALTHRCFLNLRLAFHVASCSCCPAGRLVIDQGFTDGEFSQLQAGPFGRIVWIKTASDKLTFERVKMGVTCDGRAPSQGEHGCVPCKLDCTTRSGGQTAFPVLFIRAIGSWLDCTARIEHHYSRQT